MTLYPTQMNLARHVLAAGEATPDKAALAVIGLSRAERWSYARLIAAVRGTATGLLRAGLVPGDRLLLRLGNRPAFPVAYLGAIAAGIVPIPTSALLTRSEITRIAQETNPALVVAGAGVALPDHPARVMDETELSAFETLPPAPWDMGDPERLAYIIYTSGSSGQPRAVMHAHRAILARAAMFEGWYGLRAEDRLLHAGAFNWTFTLGTGLMDPWTLGATALIPADGTEPQQIPLLAARHGASLIAAAPGVFRKMLQTEWRPWTALRHGLAAGERLDPALRAAWHARTGTELHEAMGMSECSTFLSGSPARPAPDGTAGFAQPGRRIAILDEAGAELPPGTPGRLAVHESDPGLFLGYLDQPEETASRRAGAWFLTGDLAEATSEGAIAMLGRTDDVMNAGGYRVAPAEIEEPLARVEAAGEVAAAEIAVRPGVTVIAAFWTGTASREALELAAKEHLARYKQPRDYLHLDQLPRTATGKINRRALRDRYSKDHL
ncbi:class I adenylate-forming enzyme family protein [Paracoccus aminophilus]|uniref:AMP-dependent synthetase/ligase n=1 Tax=Paracoccus aminophilus JCM 7686 TaxID=1367847 RepID=S5YDF6_PARAH|nr:class I adenylate-forming enzyme family protein [Paracoccus aminophilus]AGT09483.1 AMP-dependent synthetase/ligase [Paracoccus aminophilus JCM 7686]